MSDLAKSVLLTCEHVLWFRPSHMPAPGQELWCRQCDAPSTVPKFDKQHGTYFPDDEWTCYGKSQRTARGVCNRCGHEHEAPFIRLRQHMEKHSRSRCEWTGDELLMELINLPPNSPPPF